MAVEQIKINDTMIRFAEMYTEEELETSYNNIRAAFRQLEEELEIGRAA